MKLSSTKKSKTNRFTSGKTNRVPVSNRPLWRPRATFASPKRVNKVPKAKKASDKKPRFGIKPNRQLELEIQNRDNEFTIKQ